jgi:hypothetical protein
VIAVVWGMAGEPQPDRYDSYAYCIMSYEYCHTVSECLCFDVST